MTQDASKSELELFLESRINEGSIESHGQFTIARSKALEKIAEFQFPFANAWAVKLVQAAVAGGGSEPIRVDLLSSSIDYYFYYTGFSLQNIEEAFFTPEPSSNYALRHLINGLWAVGVKNRWSFQVALPGQQTTLIWDSKDFIEHETKIIRESVFISIFPLQQQKSGLSWIIEAATAGKRNAELFLTLESNCFACPVPLIVDGRRLDALQKADKKIWDDGRYPLSIGTVDLELPAFKVPLGTYIKEVGYPVKVSPYFDVGGCWKRIAFERASRYPSVVDSSLLYMLIVNMAVKKDDGGSYWDKSVAYSEIFWIIDGAVVKREHLLRPSHCSVNCFLSAQGLETDFSTLNLISNSELERRRELALRAISKDLPSLDNFTSKVRGNPMTPRRYAIVAASIALGIPMIIYVPLLALPAGTALFFYFAITPIKISKVRIDEFQSSLENLRSALIKEAAAPGRKSPS